MGERNIAVVNYGALFLTVPERRSRSLILTSNVARDPSNKYVSSKPRKPESFYGYMQVVRLGCVQETVAIKYDQQILWSYDNWNAEQQAWAQCAYEGILASFESLAFRLGFSWTKVIYSIKLPSCPVDGFLFNLYGETTLNLSLKTVPLSSPCGKNYDDADNPSGWESPDRNNPSNPGDERPPGSSDAPGTYDPVNPAFQPGSPYNDDIFPSVPLTGSWHVLYSGFDGQCKRFSGDEDLGITDRNAIVSGYTEYISNTVLPCGREKSGVILVDGGRLSGVRRGIELQFERFYFKVDEQ